jgi:hypothetical protein
MRIVFYESYLSTVIVNENLQGKRIARTRLRNDGGYGRRKSEMGWEVQEERVNVGGGGGGEEGCIIPPRKELFCIQRADIRKPVLEGSLEGSRVSVTALYRII